MSDTVEPGSLPIWDERNLENISRNMAVLIAVKAITVMRMGIHEFPALELTQAQHRMIRRIFGITIGSSQNKKIDTTAYGDEIEKKSLALEIIGTITGDNGRTSVMGLSRYAASNIIGELIDVKTKDITDWGRTAILGITCLIESYPCFNERDAYIGRMETDMRDMRRAHNRASRYARGNRHAWERARKLLTRKSYRN